MSKEDTREFTIRNILSSHCGESLTAQNIESIVAEFLEHMNDSSVAWAFGASKEDSKEQEIALLEEALSTIKLPSYHPDRGTGIIGRIQAYLNEHKSAETEPSLAEQYLNMIHDDDMMKRQMLENLSIAEESPQEVKDLITNAFNKILPEHRQLMLKLYNELYTEDELKALIAFRKQPAGKKEVETREYLVNESRKFLAPRFYEELNKVA